MNGSLIIFVALLLPALLHAQNLIVNSDFEAGNSGFTSQYTFSTNLGPPETYAVLNDPKKGNGNFNSIGDHTTGTGLMLVVNGSTRNDAPRAWSQTVAVATHTKHTFSFWATNLFGQNPGRLFIRINGVQIGVLLEVPPELGVWTQFSVEWNSGNAETAEIGIIFSSLSFGGNDTALDDLSFVGRPPGICDDPNTEHTIVTVPGNANPFLSGQPDGATTKGDQAPAQSPILAAQVAGNDVFSFSSTGSVSYGGATNPTTPPDGGFLGGSDSSLGIAGYSSIPVDSLVGVFLSDAQPAAPPPDQINYGTGGFSFEILAPQLRQIFFIGDGLTGNGTGVRQQFVAPPGATRLYLGTVDGYGWYNNSGAFEVSICRLSSQTFGPRLGPTTIRFDQPAYTVDAGENAVGSLIIDPLPEGGLYSQGMTVTVRSRSGALAGVISPTAAARLNNDGPLLSEAGLNSAGTGSAGIKGSALFSIERPTLTSPTLASFTAADLPPGSYDLAIAPLNELGPTEDIFVTGRCLTLDPYITFGAATLEVMGSLVPEITATGPITLQRQTGLLEQRLTIVNTSGRALNGFRLLIKKLPRGVVLQNAHGTMDGVPYIDYFGEIAAGASVELLLEYYRPSRNTKFSPTFLFAAPETTPPAGGGTILNLDLRIVRKSPAGVIVEFLTKKGKTYTIEYSENMSTWTPSLPPVTGTGQRVQWLDQGPPKTASVPGGSRFYRITNAPAP